MYIYGISIGMVHRGVNINERQRCVLATPNQ